MQTNMKVQITRCIVGLLLIGLCNLGRSQSYSNSLCLPVGYTFGFFNGVWNTPRQAADGLVALRDLTGTSYKSEPIQYETFYNTTGSVSGATGLEDVAEVFKQRAHEIDSSGELESRFEFFWESLSGEKTFSQRVINFYPSAGLLFEQLYTQITSKLMDAIAYLSSHPPTEANYASHNTRLSTLALQRQKLILVAHSQGNLFANHAYDFIVAKIGAGSVKVVHVAPASPTLRGDDALAFIDLVINGLRIQGATSVPPTNISVSELPASLSDASGHTLVGTYLDPSRGGRTRVKSLIDVALDALKTPVPSANSTGSVGSFTITLTWDGTGDVDLHTVEPNGAHSFYGSRAGKVGYLDVDNIVGLGPEHYYASCDAAVLQTGIYHVGINNYARATGRKATVQVSTSNGGTLGTRTLDVGPERGSSGDATPVQVMNIAVSKDPMTAKFSFSVH